MTDYLRLADEAALQLQLGVLYRHTMQRLEQAVRQLEARSQKDTAAMLSLSVSSNELLQKYQRTYAALGRLIGAATPIDMWMGGLWENPPSDEERHEFVLALSAAMLLVPPGGATSEQQQTPRDAF